MDARDIIGLLIGAGLLDVKTGKVDVDKLGGGEGDNQRGKQHSGDE